MNNAPRDLRRQRARRKALEADRLRGALHLEEQRRVVVALARHNVIDCGLCGRRFWPWNEIDTAAGIPIHTWCKSAWIAGRLPALDGGQRSE